MDWTYDHDPPVVIYILKLGRPGQQNILYLLCAVVFRGNTVLLHVHNWGTHTYKSFTGP
jgi:hypothetical protein